MVRIESVTLVRVCETSEVTVDGNTIKLELVNNDYGANDSESYLRTIIVDQLDLSGFNENNRIELGEENFGLYTQGISVKESGGRWVTDRNSKVYIANEQNRRNGILIFEIGRFYEGVDGNSFDLKINGKSGELLYHDDSSYRYNYVLDDDDERRFFEIEMSIDRVVSPYEIGKGTDVRKLGFFLKNISLE